MPGTFLLNRCLFEQRAVSLVRDSCRNRAHNLNRELFKGRRSLEPVGSRTDTVERGNVGNLVG